MAIRLSGMSSGLDTEKIVESLVSAKSEKKTKLEGEQKKLSWKQDAWKSLNSKIYGFYSKTVSNLRFKSDYMKRTTSSTSDAVSVTASNSSPICVQSLKVKGMAKSSYYTGAELTTTNEAGDTVKASYNSSTKMTDLGAGIGQKITVTSAGQPTDIEITADTTIGEVVSKLNKAGVSANFDTKNQRLFISAKDLGTANAFSLTGDDAALGALGLAATPTDGSEAARGKFIAAEDAMIELNGQLYTSSNNTFDINGLTITVNKKIDPNEEITLTTTQDTSGIYDMVKNFFKEYNELVNEMDKLYNADSASKYKMLTKEEKEEMSEDEIKEWEDKIKSALFRRDSTLGDIGSALKDVMLRGVTMGPEGSTYQMYLSDFGIATAGYFNSADNEKNAFHIDGDADDSVSSGNDDKLKAMIATDPDKVAEFFSSLSKNLYDKLGELMGRSEYSSAFTVYNDKLLDKQYRDYSSQIAEQEKKVTTWEDFYYKKFTAMEKALTTLQSKETAISGLFGMK